MKREVMAAVMTADELARLQDAGRYELSRGELIALAPAGEEHSAIEGDLFARLHAFVGTHRLGRVYPGDTGFRLSASPDIVRSPDVAFVRTDRLAEIADRRKYIPFAPDLAVEIISPDETAEQIQEKVADYLGTGGHLVWVVYPRTRTVHVHAAGRPIAVLSASAFLDGEDVLPGFRIGVDELFDR